MTVGGSELRWSRALGPSGAGARLGAVRERSRAPAPPGDNRGPRRAAQHPLDPGTERVRRTVIESV